MKALTAAALTALTLAAAASSSAGTLPATYRFTCVAAKASQCDARLTMRHALSLYYHLDYLYQAETSCSRSSRYLMRYRCKFGGGTVGQFGVASVAVVKTAVRGRWRVSVAILEAAG